MAARGVEVDMGALTPYMLLGGVAALLASSTGAYFIGDSHGAKRVLARVVAERAVAETLADRVVTARQATVDVSATAAAERSAFLAALAAKGRDTVKEYYRANPTADRACLSVDRVQSIRDADAAASAPRAPGDRVAPVHDASPATAGVDRG